MRPARVRFRQSGDVCILDLKGPLRLGQGEDLLERVREDLLRDGPYKVVLNFAKVSRIDDGPLGTLLHLCSGINQRGGGVRFINVEPKIASFLRITHTEGELFEFSEDEAEAVRSLTGAFNRLTTRRRRHS
jgi:anti-anti-sigma factor